MSGSPKYRVIVWATGGVGRYAIRTAADRSNLELVDACVRDREKIPAAQSIDVLFHEFMADDVAMVERIYALAGLEMTPDARRALDRFMAENPRGEHGRVICDPKADFGIEPAKLRRRFDHHFERFPIQAE